MIFLHALKRKCRARDRKQTQCPKQFHGYLLVKIDLNIDAMHRVSIQKPSLQAISWVAEAQRAPLAQTLKLHIPYGKRTPDAEREVHFQHVMTGAAILLLRTPAYKQLNRHKTGFISARLKISRPVPRDSGAQIE